MERPRQSQRLRCGAASSSRRLQPNKMSGYLVKSGQDVTALVSAIHWYLSLRGIKSGHIFRIATMQEVVNAEV